MWSCFVVFACVVIKYLGQGEKMNEYILPQREQCALIIVDTQKDFSIPGAPWEIPGTFEIIPQMKKIVEAFRGKNKPIIHVVRLYLPDGSNAELCRKKSLLEGKEMVLPGSQGSELVDELKPHSNIKLNPTVLLNKELQKIGSNEWIMYKPRWGAFYKTDLEKQLRALDINTLAFCGCNFPNCPRTSIYQASERDFRIIMIKDALSGVYEKGLQEMSNIGVNLMDTEDFLIWFKNEK